MSATGLEAFDKTLQTTNVWLDEIVKELGPDRQVAWHGLGAVLRALRDRLPVDEAAHLGAQLPVQRSIAVPAASPSRAIGGISRPPGQGDPAALIAHAEGRKTYWGPRVSRLRRVQGRYVIEKIAVPDRLVVHHV
ncbi:MAG: DUF2267 domain-containing protein [Stellaceae bacterium]|jgi:hypothetical protein